MSDRAVSASRALLQAAPAACAGSQRSVPRHIAQPSEAIRFLLRPHPRIKARSSPMRTLILSSALLAVVLMAAPQSASAQANQPLGGGGGQQTPNPSAPSPGVGSPSARPSDQSIGGGGDQQRPNPR